MQIKQQELEELYRAYGSLVFRRACRILHDEQQAEDTMQDVFVRVINNYKDFRQEASASTWLYRITTNICLNKIRDRSRQRGLLETKGRASDPTAPTIDKKIEIKRVLEKLPSELSQVAIYYYLDELEQQEIAQITGIPRRTISHRLESFRKKAKKLLGYDLQEPNGEEND